MKRVIGSVAILFGVVLFITVGYSIFHGTLNSSMPQYYFLAILNALLFVIGYILWDLTKQTSN